MDFDSSQVYEIELWSSSGTRMADISALAKDRQLTLQRNEAETFVFSMDISAFEDFCTAQNIDDPRTLLNPLQTDVKLKRAGQYWYGFNVVHIGFNLPALVGSMVTSAAPETMTITCKGYLNLFTDRYVTKTYTATEATTIAADLLTTTQAQTYGNMGVTINVGNYATGVLRDRTYERQNVKAAIQNLTKLVNGNFDFAFTYDKKFTTYSQIGSVRTDFALRFGGEGGNIAGFYMERDGLHLYNRVIGLGSGFGADQLTSVQDDNASILNYYLREDIKQYNSVIIQETLDQNAAADLDQEKDLLEIPQITITGKELENIPFLNVGDRVPISVSNHPMLASVNGLYRIERMVIDIDENDFERSITLYFDNFGVV